jgi:hypothetical protein
VTKQTIASKRFYLMTTDPALVRITHVLIELKGGDHSSVIEENGKNVVDSKAKFCNPLHRCGE